ncbi:hypothetical protein SNE40_002939 [Patella caerulea]|uniref:Zinc finger PHD-type domain-containing protein n=1 Tax=Patella caerulea TaxID=87958 RepID=A0AAN8K8Q9_PATCE
MDNCIACRSTVRPRQEGLQCEGCSLWQHRTCTDISRSTYRRAVKGLEVIRWKCSPCTNTGTPVVEDAVMSDEDPTPVVEDAVMSDEDPTPVVEDAVMSDEDPILDTSSGFIPMESFRDDQSFHVPEPAIETSLQEDNPTFDRHRRSGGSEIYHPGRGIRKG